MGQVIVWWVVHAVIDVAGVVVAHIFARRARKQTDDKAAARQRLIGVWEWPLPF